jgi:DNA helicase HerA-like ATPase
MMEHSGKRSVSLGKLHSGVNLAAPLSTIDGRLNIITGKKGTGKSHLSKLLVLGLASQGGLCIVFDVNGEYVNLNQHIDDQDDTDYCIRVLIPGDNFKVSLEYMGLRTLMSIVSAVLDLPANSAWEIRRIWNLLAKNESLTMKDLGRAINTVSNRYIQDALRRRYENLLNSGLFTDHSNEMTTLEQWINDIREGGAIIINLQRLPSSLRRIVVEFMLSKLTNLLENWFIRAVFLFAEEAHLYLRGTYWENIVTRMRHLGIFPTFVTNQPDSISDSIYRQADNIFLFNFTNENDLATVSKATMVDAQTVNTIAKELPPHHCLVLGHVVNDLPLIAKIHALKVNVMGETRLFFAQIPQLI